LSGESSAAQLIPLLIPKQANRRRFSDRLIDEERSRLYRFREIFREVMRILKNHKKEFGNIENFGNTKEKRDQSIISMI
jgi:uncharacterized protein (DUF2384 family)